MLWFAFGLPSVGVLGGLSGSRFDPSMKKRKEKKRKIYPAVILPTWCNLTYLRTKIMVNSPILLHGKYMLMPLDYVLSFLCPLAKVLILHHPSRSLSCWWHVITIMITTYTLYNAILTIQISLWWITKSKESVNNECVSVAWEANLSEIRARSEFHWVFMSLKKASEFWTGRVAKLLSF